MLRHILAAESNACFGATRLRNGWLALLFSIVGLVSLTAAQELPSRLDEAAFRVELDRLASICEEIGLTEQAIITRRWVPALRNDQTNLFLPLENTPVTNEANVVTKWSEHFAAARAKHAEFLLNRANERVQGDEQAAYIDLWHALREDPENENAKQIFGALAKGPTVRPRLTRGRVPHPDFGWPAGSYSVVDTPHFRFTTRAASRESIALAQQLEQFYVLWSQIFYPLWATPGLMEAKLAGSNAAWPKHRGMEVFLLKDREDYLQVLGVSEDNIGRSVGYYNPTAQKSFFYPSEDLTATLYHELTHQLLLEASQINAQSAAGTNGGVWILEGIALYMESLAERNGYWTVGGLESPRLQTARYRALRDGFWPDWSKFTSATIDDWKRDSSLARLYTHAAGLTHAMLDLKGPSSRERFLQALVGTYQGQAISNGLLDVFATEEQQAKIVYQDLLKVNETQLDSLVASGRQPRDLVLCASRLTPQCWNSLAAFEQLEWLDISFSNVQDSNLEWLATKSTLRRLSLEGTRVTDQVLKQVAKLRELSELDLSGCVITDTGFSLLAGHPKLEVLWLTQTQVTEASLATIDSLPSLSSCDVTNSQITAGKWEEFLDQHANLKR